MVTKKPKGLGLGLEALLGPRVSDERHAAGATDGGLRTIRIDQLQPGKYQPRTRMDEGSLQELAQSIKAQGLMQPVLVRQVSPGRFEIIAGERRVRAARMAGIDSVPVLIKDVPDEAAAAMSLIENIQREDLNPLEEAQGLRRLTSDFGMTHEQAAQAVGRSRSAASNLLRLLNLAEPVQHRLLSGEIEMGHARALLSLSAAQQILVAQQIVAKRLSVREAERLVTRGGSASPPRSNARNARGRPRDLARLEQALSDLLQLGVEIRMKRGRSGGELAVKFSSHDELTGLMQKLGLPAEQ
jgi:ParB family transcriptional regulator, chromosome partitioning protein